MFILSGDRKLSDFIKTYRIVPDSICKSIITRSNLLDYDIHKWNDSNDYYHTGDSKDFERTKLDDASSHLLNPYIQEAFKRYTFDLALSFKFSGKSTISFNRYTKSTRMKSHIDHIRSIFDGTTKGIPILTILGTLNDDYQGGKFSFWESNIYDLSAGDVIIFPSVFMYPHSVTEITEGTRYSFVQWIY